MQLDDLGAKTGRNGSSGVSFAAVIRNDDNPVSRARLGLVSLDCLGDVAVIHRELFENAEWAGISAVIRGPHRIPLSSVYWNCA